MNASSAASQSCPAFREITPAPLVCALALLGVGGLLMNYSAVPAPSSVTSPGPLSETGKVLPIVNFRLDASGKVYHQGDEVTEEDIIASGNGSGSAVIIHMEDGAPAAALMQVMRWMKAVGVKHTAVETDHE